MLHNYKSYTLIMEGKARDKKIRKTKEKLSKFIGIPSIIDWSVDKCITEKTTEGIQFAVYIANRLKDVIVDGILSTTGNDDKSVTKDRVEKFIKTGIDDKLIEKIKKEWSDLDGLVESFTEAINDDVNSVLDWLKNPLRDEKVNLTTLSFEDAIKKSEVWHNSLKATGKITDESGKILIEFDDGSYWIDLQTTYSKEESEAMGHCGNTNDGSTLLSYRDRNKSPHITVAYDDNDGAIYQMKGRQNKKPVEKYFPYIYRLLVDPNLKPRYFAYEYLKEEDFNLSDFDRETFKKVYNYNPNLVYESIQYDVRMMRNLIKKNYLEKDDIVDVILNSGNMKIDAYMSLLDEFDENGKEIESIFTDEELKSLYKKSNINLSSTGELLKIVLFDRNIIDVVEFASYFKELLVEDKNGIKILNIEGDEDDLDPFMSDGVKSLLFDDMPFENWDYPYYKIDSSRDVWFSLTKETKEKVVKNMIGEEINYNYWRGNKEKYFNDVEIKENMIQWKNNDYYFVYNDNDYKIDEILDENKNESLSDLYTALSIAQNEAQRLANEREYYKKTAESIEEIFGPYTTTYKRINNKYYKYLIFDFYDVVDLDDVKRMLYENYESWDGNSIDWNEEQYGNFWSILNEFGDVADFNDDYGLYGDIDDNELNEAVIYQLDDI